MFRVFRSRLAIGAYSLFMVEQKNNPALKGLDIAQRGKMTSKLYRALSSVEREALEKRAKATPSKQRAAKTTKGSAKGSTKGSAKGSTKTKKTKTTKKREPSQYAQFVKNNLAQFKHLPHRERMAAVAKLWKQQQPKKN